MVVFIHSILQKLRSALKNERGEANYFSTVVFIFIAVVLLAFIIDLFGIISTKQELDHAADQMVKQIQLSGGINSETDALFDFLCSEIEGADNITYSIDATYKSPTPSGMSRAIQLGTPFYITIEGDAKLGGFWNLDLVNITVVALSQLSRPEGGKPKPPTLASLRSSGQIEQDADVVMFIFREEPGLLRSRRILRVAKNKEGETGQIPLVFRGETQTFRPDSVGIMLPRTKEEPQYKQMEFGALEDPGEDTPEEFRKN